MFTLKILFLYSLIFSVELLLIYGVIRYSRVASAPKGRVTILVSVLTVALAAASPLLIAWLSRKTIILEIGPYSPLTPEMFDGINEPTSLDSGWKFAPLRALSIVYAIGLGAALLRLLITIGRILLIAARSERRGNIILSDRGDFSPFSWGRMIFISRDDLNTPAAEMLLTHEEAHLRAYHWLDLLILNLLGCLTWYCPAARLIRRELQMAHEFEADSVVLSQGYDPRAYQLLLISKASGRRFANSVADCINNHSLKKRIIMMQKKSLMRPGLLRSLALLPASLLVLAFATTPVLAHQAESLMPAKVEVIQAKADTTKADNNKVFTEVEVAPVFPGGEMKMYEHLTKNIRYPEDCAKRNIQGRVIVQFVVEKDGSVGEAKVVRPQDPQLDEEAIRVVRTFPKFTPGTMNGEPVRVWYTIPITFKLSNKK